MKKKICLLGLSLLSFSQVRATSIDWTGTYRFEFMELDKTTLESGRGRKSYVLSHLNLNPKIIATDSVSVVGNFEILGNDNYPNSQLGQQFGSGANAGSTTNMNGGSSNVSSQESKSSTLKVRELYATINQEYGQLVVGRAPVQFGLGMTYSAGKGTFDHWGDIEDMVAHRFQVGTISITPMLGKPYDFSPAQGRDVTDAMIDIEYNNPETESTFGLFYKTRTSSQASNDAYNVFDKGVNSTYTNTTANSGWSSTHTNLILMRGWDSFKFKMEAGFETGSTGINAVSGASSDEIKLNGYGIALEMEFPKTDWKWNLRAGLASGDNPQTANYEGYQFDRNYDVGFLLFNHPMGGYDVLTSNRQRSRICGATTCTKFENEEAVDEETVSNAAYLSPRFTIAMSDKWDWRNTLVYAQAQTNPSRVAGNDPSKDLGWEWDTAFIYRPHERIQWVNEVGMFLPGNAFKDGSVGRDAGFTYGVQSKAAISF